ncbi:TetR/AcrR family transcriptional regulator [Microbacterium suwonense]|uniref:TetR family transcriptional regulator n=1 Tax=Microbacterium suwonense TaxID=683047 RepID=A0ABN6X3L2_9MICO|nr:TetR/AcrR family transcriptional regulator [Microbacterium suwonense]BDZ39284.1 TetR family transcriptional regulator [Microbacterium suwonense]
MATRKGEHHGSAASKRAILEAVLSRALEAGYEGTTMVDVARASGLPIGSVYWHFQNKEQLFAELLDYCFEIWKDANPPSRSMRERLRISIGTSAAASAGSADPAAAFWSIGLIFALRRFDDNAARQRYLGIRAEMFTLMAERLRAEFPALPEDEANKLARDITGMARAVTDGFRIAAAAGDDTDFEHAAAMAADALEHLIRTRVSELTDA